MKTKVLLIEDEDLLTQMYSHKFKADGYDCFIAENGEQGIKIAKRESPDIILCDIMMPKKDGIQTLKELKISKDTKNIPVIMLTNLHEKEYAEKALELGAKSYYVKTQLIPSDIVKKVKRLLKTQKS